VVLDVRDEHELVAGWLEGSRMIPLSALPSRLQEVPPNEEVVVYCEGGSRSAIAASLLQAAGIKGVFDMAGGINAWKSAGQPVELKSPATAHTGP